MFESRRNNYDPMYNGYPNYPDPFGRNGYWSSTLSSGLKRATGIYSLQQVADNVIEKIVEKQLKNVKNYFGTEFTFTEKDSIPVIKWLAAHDPKFKTHIDNPQVLNDGVSKQALDMVSISNQEFFIILDEGTFAHISAQDKYHSYSSSNIIFSNDDNGRGTDRTGIYRMHIYIFGRYMRKYASELSKSTKVNIDNMCQYIVMGGEHKNEYTITAKELNLRPIDSLFFDDNVKETVTNHIDKWLDNEQLYHDRSLLFKTGILLEGPAGTGKSSLVTALATKYNMEIVNINMPSFRNIDIDRVIDSINADNNKYIVLLEEIDCVFGKGKRDDNQADKDDKMYISDLLQFIDSSKSPNNVIFIATTNHPEMLDEALIRKGRFDLTVNVGPLYKESKVIDMCKSFDLEQDQINDILENITYPIPQSSLQYEILKRIENKIGVAPDDSKKDEDEKIMVEMQPFELASYPQFEKVKTVRFIPIEKLPKTASFVDTITPCTTGKLLSLYKGNGYAYIVATHANCIAFPEDCSHMFAGLTRCKHIIVDGIDIDTGDVKSADGIFEGDDSLIRNDLTQSLKMFYVAADPDAIKQTYITD